MMLLLSRRAQITLVLSYHTIMAVIIAKTVTAEAPTEIPLDADLNHITSSQACACDERGNECVQFDDTIMTIRLRDFT